MKTVLFFDHTAKLGGGEIALLELLRALDKSRFRPVVVLGAEGPLAEKLRESNIETHILPLADELANTRKESLGAGGLLRLRALAAMLAYCWRLARFIKQNRADLVHTNSLKSDIIGGISARLARTPVVWHVRDRIESDYIPAAMVRVFRVLCRIVPNFVVANSAATLKTIKLPAGARACRVVHDGVVPRAAAAPHASSSRALIGLVGRISPWKGQHVFLAAAAKVLTQFPTARFQIIGAPLFGEEEYEREIKELARSSGLEEAAEFTGFRKDVPELIDGLDILVHASTTGEPFGQVIIEGMIAAKPVVATDGGGVPEIVQDGVTGILVPMGDADAMADAICKLLAAPAKARCMGQAGRERVLEHFTVELTGRRLEAVFEQMSPSTGSMSQSEQVAQSEAA